MNQLLGKVVIVTGASHGIGECIAKKMASYGANVVLAARSEPAITKHVADIQSAGGKATAITCDVSKYPNVKGLIETTIQEYGKVDILVNNAGTIDPIAHLSNSDPELWGQAIDTNVKGVYYGVRAVLPFMIEQGGGHIINMSSGAANSALEGWSHYCASKAAVKKITEIAHQEVAEKGICVVGLSPGTVATNMMKKIKDSSINPVSQLPWSNHIDSEWVAVAVAFLSTGAAWEFAGTDFSLKTPEGRQLIGMPQ